ncbi:MAG: 3'(2'),5'-bisphosphate nucleotidase CysQ [Clostridia bacterium]|nr:3'(2'),5'-bisphosphate nucleotidase CysQ [Clostridia bacterium]
MTRGLEKELASAIEAALKAGECIRKVYRREFDVEIKEDHSPLTEADLRANQAILSVLKPLFPEDGFLTEEEEDNKFRLEKERCWIIDPLDGTREFVKKNDEFTVNIALSKGTEVVLGVVYAPIFDELYYAVKGVGAFKREKDGTDRRIHVSDRLEGLHGLQSQSKPIDMCIDIFDRHAECVASITKLGSSLKGCRIAEGVSDVYFNCGRSMVWDTAAMECIVVEAGGVLKQLNGKPILYNVEKIVNDRGFYILNDARNNLVLK